MLAHMDILKSAEDGGDGGGILWGGVNRGSGSETGIPSLPHHFQHGGGCSSATLSVSDGGGCRRAGRVRKRGNI